MGKKWYIQKELGLDFDNDCTYLTNGISVRKCKEGLGYYCESDILSGINA